MTWTQLWAECTERLGDSDDARRIIEAASGRKGASWLITLDETAPTSAAEKVRDMIDRRLAGEPLQYVVGTWGFRHLNLKVDKRVLIPRPETEQVVEAALAILKNAQDPLVVDLGTGSGAIALSIATEHPSALVYATDKSLEALEVADYNLSHIPAAAQERVMLVQGSWFEPLPSDARFDLIISNPPYVAEIDGPDVEEQVTEWEPHSALFAGPDGLDDIRHIVAHAPQLLKPRGSLIVELSPEQAQPVAIMASSSGFDRVAIGKDLAGRERFLVAAAP